MIVYNVLHKFFDKKNDAERYRREQTLPADRLHTLRIEGREDLCTLLNGICDKAAKNITDAPKSDEAPAYIPTFLLKDKEEREKRRQAGSA